MRNYIEIYREYKEYIEDEWDSKPLPKNQKLGLKVNIIYANNLHLKAKIPRMFPKKGFYVALVPEDQQETSPEQNMEYRTWPDGKCWAGFGALVLT